MSEDSMAEKILRMHKKNNHCCVAVMNYENEWFVASNGFRIDDSIAANALKIETALVNLGYDSGLHAEMRIISRLLKGKPSDQISRGMFSSHYIGISKEVCGKCAVILNFLGIEHRDAHARKTELDGWDFPHAFFENDPEFSGLNDGRHPFGEDSSDFDYTPES